MANPVPKPGDQRRRRNAHTPHDRKLPLAGRTEAAPKPPVRLGPAGRRWWKAAWASPQATTWNPSYCEALAKRAELEDLWTDLRSDGDLAGLTKLVPLMLRADATFGLTPKAAAELHLVFEDAPVETPETPVGVTDIRDRIRRLSS